MEQYRLGDRYRDTGSSGDPDDQFLRWINIPGSGIRNMGGIRPLKFTNLRLPVHAYIVLVTHERSTGSASNRGRTWWTYPTEGSCTGGMRNTIQDEP
jgi:hypothetical protein